MHDTWRRQAHMYAANMIQSSLATGLQAVGSGWPLGTESKFWKHSGKIDIIDANFWAA